MNRLGIYLGFPPEGGGAFQYANSIVEAAAALPPSDFEIVAVYTHPAWQERLEVLAAHVRPVAARSGAYDAAVAIMLRSGLPARFWRRHARRIHPLAATILRLQCDCWVFPAQDYLTYALPVASIGVVHDLMHRYERRFPEVSALGLFQRRERHYKNLVSHARAVLVDSEIGRQHVIEAYGPAPEKIHILPYAIPTHIDPGSGAPQSWSLPDKYLFYPAQFWHHKNHVGLLHALARARLDIPDLHLVLVGSPKNADREVMETIERLGLQSHVHVLGYVPDTEMSILYRHAVALVMPTFFGPTNIPPLEAMALECPVIVSGVYGMRNQLRDAAEYVDPDSSESIATAILHVVGNKKRRQQLIEAGRRRSAELSQSRFNDHFATIIGKVISK